MKCVYESCACRFVSYFTLPPASARGGRAIPASKRTGVRRRASTRASTRAGPLGPPKLHRHSSRTHAASRLRA